MNEIRARPTDRAGRFAEWVGPALLSMRRLAVRLAPSSDADDIVQEALIRAWLKWDQFDPERGTPTGWLGAITANLAHDDTRARARRSRIIDDTTPLVDGAAPSHDADADDDVDLQRALDRLTGRQRLAVECFYFVSLSIDETAEVMGCTPGTVKSTLFDARATLRAILGDQNDEH